jgi:hypothetical protein
MKGASTVIAVATVIVVVNDLLDASGARTKPATA